ncbi:MAG: hypothetical protein HYT50_01070 [Candidatus Wildermuthbacteria bacterium]|nr:hypothetical protein [Candidatus Wildermuthbacteria bacterium]
MAKKYIFGIAAVLLLAGGGIFAWQKGWIAQKESLYEAVEQKEDVFDWRVYEEPYFKFSFEYPAHWVITDEVLYTPGDELGYVNMGGKEGDIMVAWGTGFGGYCDLEFQESVNVLGIEQVVCHTIEDGKEEWRQIYRKLSDTATVAVSASAYSPSEVNRELILDIFSSFVFSGEIMP